MSALFMGTLERGKDAKKGGKKKGGHPRRWAIIIAIVAVAWGLYHVRHSSIRQAHDAIGLKLFSDGISRHNEGRGLNRECDDSVQIQIYHLLDQSVCYCSVRAEEAAG